MRVIAIAVLAAVFVAGCGTPTGLPIKVTEAYTVRPGNNVGLVALPTTPAFVAEVEVDLSQIEIPMPFQTQEAGVPLAGSGWLVFGAERAPNAPSNNVVFPTR